MLSVAACLALAVGQQTDLRLPNLFSDNMVVQRDRPVRVWGWSTPGRDVTVTLGGRMARGTAGIDGKFTVELRPLRAGGPYELMVSGGGEKRVRNVMVGEIWVCSGQSNMEWELGWLPNADEESAKAFYPNIRFLTVPRLSSETPVEDMNAAWQPCRPDTVRRFSAVGYYFGKVLHERLGVPIGLINTSWGGTPAESWTPRPALARHPDLRVLSDRFEEVLRGYPEAKASYDRRLSEWQMSVTSSLARLDEGATWTESPTAEAGWKPMEQPGLWEGRGLPLDGTVWLSREVAFPGEQPTGEAKLRLGPIDDYDTVYLNGVKVGSTGFAVQEAYRQPREYTFDAALIRPGTNVLSVRVHDTGGGGGFGGAQGDLLLEAGGRVVPLAGTWFYKVEKGLPPGIAELLRGQPQPPLGPGNPWAPGGLWNGMVAPLVRYPIRGAIWYQGESNANRAYQYRQLFPYMIGQWRQAWGQGDFPFLFVQLANFMARRPEPGQSEWAELREAQLMTLKTAATGMAVAIDIGDALDIHPQNKKDVGLRLALNALQATYRQNVVPAGPLYRSHRVEGAKVRITFANAQGLKAMGGGPLKGFSIAGSDRKFVWADAVVERDAVVVSSKAVPNPAAVRYGWADNPEVNLVNAVGLPASPFRTDTWPGLTIDRK